MQALDPTLTEPDAARAAPDRIDPSLPTPRPAPLRVAVVTETYPPEVNGVAMTIGRMVAELRARGHQVQLVRPRQHHDRSDMADAHDGATEGDGSTHRTVADQAFRDIHCTGIPMPGYAGLKFGLPATSTLRRAWAAWRPDVVQVVTEGPLGWSAVRAARALRIPVVSEFHTHFERYSQHYHLGWLQRVVGGYLRSFHNRAQLTLAPTRRLAEQMMADGYRQVQVVARGVDAQLFHPDKRHPELRQQWGVRPGELAVLHVGRLAAEKNLPLLLEAFHALQSVHPARLILVGDGPLRAKLQARHPQLVFCGVQRGEHLARHYASADLFLFPSLTETYGNVLLEAMASGLPSIAFDYAAAAEHLRHGQSGLLVPYADHHAFVDAAEDLLHHPFLLPAMGAQARLHAEHIGWRRIFDQLEHTLRVLTLAVPHPPTAEIVHG